LTAAEFVRADQDMDADADHSRLEQVLEGVLSSLTDREAFVLRKRFGINETHVYSLRETGLCLGVSRERVRQIEKQALEKLRRPHGAAVLAGYHEEYL
jgi:RNA polymerase primary sigma factor